MKKIRVHTSFNLTKDDYSQVHYAAGEHTVPESVADHWFTLQHAEVVGNGKEEQAEVDALFQAEIAELQKQVAERDDSIAELQKQVAELQESKGAKNVKKQEPAN